MSSSMRKGLEMEDNNCDGKMAKEDDVEEESRHLPDEIIYQHILPCLPIKPLVRCKLLSKQWNLKINSVFDHIIFSTPFTPLHSLFIQSGTTFYLYSCTNHDYNDGVGNNVEVADNNLVRLNVNFEVDSTIDTIKLVGSSNGLVCLAENNGKYFYLYNPNTDQTHKYYPADYNYWNKALKKPWVNWGFGYVSSVDDYKVVRIIPHVNGEVAVVHVYSLKSNMWSKLQSGWEEGDMTIGHAHLVNETLYWSMCSGRTLAFDLARETFEFFPPLSVNHLLGSALCVMGGCLSKCSSNSRDDLIVEIVKHPPRVSCVVFSCDLKIEDPKEFKYCKQLFGFTKSGKVFYTREKPGMLGLLDRCSKRTLATFDDQLFIIESYVPSQSSPHPAADLPNEPPEILLNMSIDHLCFKIGDLAGISTSIKDKLLRKTYCTRRCSTEESSWSLRHSRSNSSGLSCPASSLIKHEVLYRSRQVKEAQAA